MSSDRQVPDSVGAHPGVCVWHAADSALRISAPEVLLAEIAAEVHRAHFSAPRGVEIAGVLFGRRTPTGLELAGWQPIRRASSNAPSFTLAQRDLGMLACLLDGLNEQLRHAGQEVLGWFVTRVSAYATPSRADLDLQHRFFATAGDVLLIVDAQRTGETTFHVFLYGGMREGLQPSQPAWRFAAHALPEPVAAPVPYRPLDAPHPATAESQDEVTIAAQRRLLEAMSAPPRRRGGLRDALPYGVLHLLAALLLLAIGVGAYLYLFRPDVTRPLLTMLNAGAHKDARTVALAVHVAGDLVTVKWNGDAEVLKDAQSVRLVIDQSADANTLKLTPDAARSGVYQTHMRPAPVLVTMVVVPKQGERFRETFTLTRQP